ncbi:MAG: hypothetical protein H5U20_05290, partial [Rhodobacteraceae bacterium]|nr:hypothetical protein [Paracoccaceae bacterium]
MTEPTRWGGGKGALAGAGAVAVVAVVAALLWPEAPSPDDAPAAADAPGAPVAGAPGAGAPAAEGGPPDGAAPDAVAEAPADAAAAPAPDDAGADAAAVPTPGPIEPGFDLVRVEADGQALVAGSAAPGALVEVLLDGDVVAEAVADGSGNFVALFTAAPAEIPRVLSLRSRLPGADAFVASAASVIIAPRPQVVAEADTDT